MRKSILSALLPAELSAEAHPADELAELLEVTANALGNTVNLCEITTTALQRGRSLVRKFEGIPEASPAFQMLKGALPALRRLAAEIAALDRALEPPPLKAKGRH